MAGSSSHDGYASDVARVVFKNANLIDGENPAQPKMTIAICGERIEAVCPDAAFQTRATDEVHDLEGRSLMPGMVQSHFHSHFGAFGDGVSAPSLGLEAAPAYLSMLAASNAELALECGFTGAIGSSNAHAIDVSLKEAILAGIVTGPRYLAGSREIITTGEASDFVNNRNFFMDLGHTGLSYQANGSDEWCLAARTEAGRGCDVIKLSAGPGHGSSVDIIDHADRIDEECVEAILEAGSFVVPSMLWSERFLELAESWDHDATRLPISEGFPETPDEVRARIRGVREDFDYTSHAMPAAARAGVKMVVGDDFGTPIMPHGDYIPEFELYVKRLGIPPLDVLRWATQNGAELMGLGEETGTIEAGKLADLLIVDGDPLVDISCLADRKKLQAILLGGTWIKNDLPNRNPS